MTSHIFNIPISILFVLVLTFSSNYTVAQETKHELAQLKSDVSYLSNDSLEGREMGTIGEIIAATYIAKRYAEIGLIKKGSADTSYFQSFTKKTKLHPHDYDFSGPVLSGRNVLGLIDNNSTSTIVVGAHYDHLGWGAEGSLHTGEKMIHNGADDNASGVASLLYLAEELSNHKLNYNVLFVAFTGEEKGLLGSNYFMNNLSMEASSIDFMVNMDMVGRLDENRRLAVYGVGTSPSFIPAINQIESPVFQFKMDSSGVGPSDHTSFYIKDIPVLHFFTGQHAQYHRPEDDVELINFNGLYDVSHFIEKLILSLNQEDKLAFNKTRDKEQKGRKFNVTLGIVPDYLFSGIGLKVDGTKEARPAAKAGMLKGDVILKIGDIKIAGMTDYMKALNFFHKGDETSVIILRNGAQMAIKVVFD